MAVGALSETAFAMFERSIKAEIFQELCWEMTSRNAGIVEAVPVRVELAAELKAK